MLVPNYLEILNREFAVFSRRALAKEEDASDESDDMQKFWLEYKDKLLELSIVENDEVEFQRDLSFKWIVLEYLEKQLTL